MIFDILNLRPSWPKQGTERIRKRCPKGIRTHDVPKHDTHNTAFCRQCTIHNTAFHRPDNTKIIPIIVPQAIQNITKQYTIRNTQYCILQTMHNTKYFALQTIQYPNNINTAFRKQYNTIRNDTQYTIHNTQYYFLQAIRNTQYCVPQTIQYLDKMQYCVPQTIQYYTIQYKTK